MSTDALFDESVGRDPRADTWTVAELSAHLNRVLAGVFPDDVWIAGQIRNLNRSSLGHVYFNLAEPTGAGEQPRAQLSVTLLNAEKQLVNEQLKRAGGAVRMADGIEVRIQGRIRWYGPRGTLQLRMHGIDPAFTIGRLQEDRERILATLVAEGLFERNRAVAFPMVPLRIGLVTSIGSAAHADVLAELGGSGIAFTVRSVDARTQGAECERSVVRALTVLAADGVDVVLLVRGGGARTDLAAFDSEAIARAIASVPVAVLTGIGHELDRSIADEVAHASFKTPTAAAARVVEQVRTFLDLIDGRASAIHRAVTRSLSVAGSRLDERTTRSTRRATRTIDRQLAVLDAGQLRLAPAAARSLDVAHAGLDRPVRAVAERGRRATDRGARELDGVAARVAAHDPRRALARGWTITTTEDGRLVRQISDVVAGTRVTTRLADGQVHSTVDATEPDPTSQEQPR